MSQQDEQQNQDAGSPGDKAGSPGSVHGRSKRRRSEVQGSSQPPDVKKEYCGVCGMDRFNCRHQKSARTSGSVSGDSTKPPTVHRDPPANLLIGVLAELRHLGEPTQKMMLELIGKNPCGFGVGHKFLRARCIYCGHRRTKEIVVDSSSSSSDSDSDEDVARQKPPLKGSVKMPMPANAVPLSP